MNLLNIVKECRWLYFVIKRRLSVKVQSFKRFFINPVLPQNDNGKVMIHLGCGDVVAPGYINVDLKSATHVHFVHDVTNLPFFKDNSADLVYACHVMEHFPFEQIKRILWEWRRVLKIGGTLRLSVPDFDKLLVIYRRSNNEVESIRQPLMGAEDGYFSHLLIFNLHFIKKLLEENGFENVRIWNPAHVDDHDFQDWSSRGLVYGDSTYQISLNVEADKVL